MIIIVTPLLLASTHSDYLSVPVDEIMLATEPIVFQSVSVCRTNVQNDSAMLLPMSTSETGDVRIMFD